MLTVVNGVVGEVQKSVCLNDLCFIFKAKIDKSTTAYSCKNIYRYDQITVHLQHEKFNDVLNIAVLFEKL